MAVWDVLTEEDGHCPVGQQRVNLDKQGDGSAGLVLHHGIEINP